MAINKEVVNKIEYVAGAILTLIVPAIILGAGFTEFFTDNETFLTDEDKMVENVYLPATGLATIPTGALLMADAVRRTVKTKRVI
ncbi:MAG: hypothetical protein AAB439_03285 [Patescibacteria group bacterium]